MKPVYQQKFGYGQGSCMLACIASIFEVTEESLRLYDFLAPNHEDLAKWTELVHPELVMYEEDRGYNFRLIDADPSWGGDPQRWTYDVPEEFEPPPVEFWIASVNSPGLVRPTTDPYYPMPALHAVVMQGDRLVHDPNPNYAHTELYSPVVMRTWWEPRA